MLPSKRTRCFRACAALLLLCTIASCGSIVAFYVAMYHSPIFSSTPAALTAEYRGVNLGGWLILEPWITPSLFFPWLCNATGCSEPPVIDEASFCERLGSTEATIRLKSHRDTWVTRATFDRIASLGLNVVRVPFGHWVYGDSEDVCPGVSSIEYLDRAVDWAEATGLRVILDMHVWSMPPPSPLRLRPPHAASGSCRASNPTAFHPCSTVSQALLSSPPGIQLSKRAVFSCSCLLCGSLVWVQGVDAGANGMDNSGLSSKPPWRAAWDRPPFDASDWTKPVHINFTRSVLTRVAARYANRTGTVVRLGLVNEPLLSTQPLWCTGDCPMDIGTLLRTDSATWQRVNSSRHGQLNMHPVIDVGLGGTPDTWSGAMHDAPQEASDLVGANAIFDFHVYQAWWAVAAVVPASIDVFGLFRSIPTRWIPQAVHLRAAACDTRDTLLGFEHATSLRAMVGVSHTPRTLAADQGAYTLPAIIRVLLVSLWRMHGVRVCAPCVCVCTVCVCTVCVWYRWASGR